MAVVGKLKHSTPNPEQRHRRMERERLLKSLIYELWDGKPVYYDGYKEVLTGIKTVEQLMSSSILQSLLASRLIAYLSNSLDMNTYAVLGNDLGIQFKKGDWRACDVAIFTLEQLEGQDWEKYAWVPPKVAIEIDTKADMSRFNEPFDYYGQKTERLLDFGVEKVVWLFTKSRKTWIAEPNQDWVIKDWNQPIDILSNCLVVPDQLLPNPKKE
ncbi:hypothetical protein GCM10027341_45850 [Spirosoma knui]